MPKAAKVSTAGKLKYAEPCDLPSFQSSGRGVNDAAASAAASLGWANRKPPALWRPESSLSASAAAVLGKDYRSSPVREPADSNGANKAALLAVDSAGTALKKASPKQKEIMHEQWGNSAAAQAFCANFSSSADPISMVSGNSAATQAFRKSNKNAVPESASQFSTTISVEQRSLAAAKEAMASFRGDSGRRPNSAPDDSYALGASAVSSALNSATLAHRNSGKPKLTIEDIGAVPITNMNRHNFTSHPQVKYATDEERLHKTAVDMARKMYQFQQKKLQHAKDQDSDNSSTPFAGSYLNLQDAAYKQAQERLAKLHDEHQQNREAQEYYGNVSSPRHRLSMGSKLRRQSAGDLDPEDKARTNQIREQMSMFSSKLSRVDMEKRAKDREALLAAAQRNVKARLQGMDDKMSLKTGKRNTSMLSDWDLKAQRIAQAHSATRSKSQGKIDIGGGKFMDPEEINAIAAKRLKPVLDDINEKVEEERARLATLRAEEDARREELERIRAEERAEKEEAKKAKAGDKAEEKAKRAGAKHESKTKKEDPKEKKSKGREKRENTVKAEQDQLTRDERRKSEVGGVAAASECTAATASEAHEAGDTQPVTATCDCDSEDFSNTENELKDIRATGTATARRPLTAHGTESTESMPRISTEGSDSSVNFKSGLKGWIKKRLSASRDKKSGCEKMDKEPGEKRRSFFGGAHKSKTVNANNASSSSLEDRSHSICDVALAHKNENHDAAAREDENLALQSVGDKVPTPEVKEPEPEGASATKADASKMVYAGNLPVTTIVTKAAVTKAVTTRESKINADSRGVSPIGNPSVPDDVEERNLTLEPLKLSEKEIRRSSSIARDSRFKEEM